MNEGRHERMSKGESEWMCKWAGECVIGRISARRSEPVSE
jgi:hypothetical protein